MKIDLGDGHYLEPVTGRGHGEDSPFPVTLENCVGVIETHQQPDGQGECSGYVRFRGRGSEDQPQWDVLSVEPLTLSPSILCRTCGAHGFVREGKWVPA
jgi:hypothetical protein